jgi:AcrR family transcriptional regulator/DNA-binding MarR family transcriptional regulator
MGGPRTGGRNRLSGVGAEYPDGHKHVAEIQRARILAAMVEVASERGAGNVTVARVVARSGVSRRTFYELFTGGEECLLAVMEDSLVRARSCVLEVYDPREAWRVRVRAALHVLLGFVEDEPARGRLLIVESLRAGPEALERRSRVLAELIVAVDAGRRENASGSGLTPLTAEGVVGSVLSIIHARLLVPAGVLVPARVVGGGRLALVELTNPLMSMIALPYLGAAAARRELDRPLPEHRRRAPHASNGAGHLNDLPMRITYRTLRVLSAIASQPGASNRQAGESAGITDQGQISKLLHRLEKLGLLLNAGADQAKGMPNAWMLTEKGAEIERAIGRQTSGSRSR